MGLGSRWGFLATWSYLIYDLLGPAASNGFLGYVLSETLRTEFGVKVPWWLLALAAFAIIWIDDSLWGPAVDAHHCTSRLPRDVDHAWRFRLPCWSIPGPVPAMSPH